MWEMRNAPRIQSGDLNGGTAWEAQVYMEITLIYILIIQYVKV
jgi:hypothetical protein